YQKALADAHRRYEEERQQYTKAVSEIRDQLDRAPQEFEDRFHAMLEQFKGVCAGEREKVVAAGGLHIVGTERHESRRIDNQLRGRAGRQGDPGSSRFFLSLEDDLLRIFGADRIQGLMQKLGMEEGVPIEHKLINRAVSNAQSKVEAHHFDVRKHLLEYDDVMNKQREVVYHRRRNILGGEELKEDVLEIAEGLGDDVVENVIDPETAPSDWDWKAIGDAVTKQFNVRLVLSDEERERMTAGELTEAVIAAFRQMYEQKEREVTPPVMRHLEKVVMLQTLDTLWKDHLLSMDHLKEGIGLRGYGQKNPLQEYQKEGFTLFEAMLARFEEEVVERLATVQVVAQAPASAPARQVQRPPQGAPPPGQPSPETLAMMRRLEERQRADAARQQHRLSGPQQQPKSDTVRREADKVGRNDPCPCGSGKKYKKCHG
ncbi:MAG: SEC-C metal-binding domain-containing protein, partial [Candidatus Binatia bacterium]